MGFPRRPAGERRTIFLESGPLRRLLPAAVHVAETDHDPALAAQRNPFAREESAGLARAAERRRVEFLTTRACAHEALAAAGAPRQPLLRGSRGEPRWPGGFVGSLTHFSSSTASPTSYRAAAVATADRFAALGIDAEEWAPLPEGIRAMVCTQAERQAARGFFPGGPDHADRLVFSVKESFYKARFPLTRSWLDFLDVEVSFGPAGTGEAGDGRPGHDGGAPDPGDVCGTFSVEVANPARRHPALPDMLAGRFLVRGTVVATAVMLER